MAEDSGEVVREQSESVAATNLKVLGDGPAFYMNQAYAETLANTQAMNQIRTAITSKAAESLLSMQPSEAAGEAGIAAVLAKIIQGAPPPTNLPTQGQ